MSGQVNFCEQNPKIFCQGLFETSLTQKHRLGTKWVLADGRVFVYAKSNASTALIAGTVNQGPVPDAAHDELTGAAASVGDTSLVVTIGASACVANQYAEGFVRVNKGTLLGSMYKIKSHAANAGSLPLTLYLYDEIRAAITDEELSIVPHPANGVLIHPSPPTAALQGVAPIAVPVSSYFWNQVKGPAAVLMAGTPVIGAALTYSAATDGALTVQAEADTNEPFLGICIQVPATTEIGMAMLQIPGY